MLPLVIIALFFILSVGMSPVAVPALATDVPRPFWEDREFGWFWYEDPPLSADENPEPPPDAFLFLKQLDLDGVDLETLPLLSLKWLLQAKREHALDAPTVESVREYFLVHKASFNRAQRFTDMWQLALMQEPELDFNTEHPPSALGHQINVQMTHDQDQQILSEFRQEGGLFFFFTSKCPYCQAQSKVLKVFADEYGIKIFPITQNGEGLPEFPNAQQDNGMGESIGVKMVPALVFALPEARYLVPIGAGFLTKEEITRRIVTTWKARSARGVAQP